jgi:hypothetical protein
MMVAATAGLKHPAAPSSSLVAPTGKQQQQMLADQTQYDFAANEHCLPQHIIT